MPMDGFTLTEALHQYGINIRYLGTVLEYIEKSPQKIKLDHVYVSASHVMSYILMDFYRNLSFSNTYKLTIMCVLIFL